MLVKDRMTPNPITITEDTSHADALRLVRERAIRRLPVLDRQGRLVGIVAEKDLLYAAPSPATTLSVYELHYALARLKVKQIMTHDVVTTTPETTIEEAARVMAERKIGCLPVMEDDRLVGIITETDLFKSLLMLFGGLRHGLRLTMRVPARRGVLAAVAGEVARLGGNIMSVGSYYSDDPLFAFIIMKIEDAPQDDLLRALRDMGEEVLDVREV
jgi:acetoin utilization protein AcuB